MEYVDVLDETTGEVTGGAERAEAHRLGLWHKVVHVWLLNSRGEVLIQLRAAAKKSYPNVWSMSWEGHVAAGVSSLETAVVEAHEELGLVIQPHELHLLKTYQIPQDTPRPSSHHFVDVYLLSKDVEIDHAQLQVDEVADVRWIPLKDYREKIDSADPTFRDHPGEFPWIFDALGAVLAGNR